MQARIIVYSTNFLILSTHGNPCAIKYLFKKPVTYTDGAFLYVDDFENFRILILNHLLSRHVLSWFQALDELYEEVSLLDVLKSTRTKFTTLPKEQGAIFVQEIGEQIVDKDLTLNFNG